MEIIALVFIICLLIVGEIISALATFFNVHWILGIIAIIMLLYSSTTRSILWFIIKAVILLHIAVIVIRLLILVALH